MKRKLFLAAIVTGIFILTLHVYMFPSDKPISAVSFHSRSTSTITKPQLAIDLGIYHYSIVSWNLLKANQAKISIAPHFLTIDSPL